MWHFPFYLQKFSILSPQGELKTAILYSVHCKWLATYRRYEYNQMSPFLVLEILRSLDALCSFSFFSLLTDKKSLEMENAEIIN